MIVLDEPDSGLDSDTAEDIIQMLRSVSLRGATVIAITHHRHVLKLFDRVIEMEATDDGGQVAADSCPGSDGEGCGLESSSQSVSARDDQIHTLVAKPLLGTIHQQIPIVVVREIREFISRPLCTIAVGSRSFAVPSCLISLLLVPLLWSIREYRGFGRILRKGDSPCKTKNFTNRSSASLHPGRYACWINGRQRQLPATVCHCSSVPHSGQGSGGSMISIASEMDSAS